MHLTKSFASNLDEIPVEKWERSTSIGKFSKLDILEVIHRPYSEVVKTRINGEASQLSAYVKKYRNVKNIPAKSFSRLVENDFHTLDYYYKKFLSSERFRVVKPLLVIPEKYILATEEARGTNLHHLIIKRSAFFPRERKLSELLQYMNGVGGWLKYFHSLKPMPAERYLVEELIEFIDTRLIMLTEEKKRHFPDSYRNRILKFLEQNKSKPGEKELKMALSHNDFNPGNIIVDGEFITCVDFGRTGKNSFLFDVSRFYHQLYLMTIKPQYRVPVIKKLQKALLKGFGEPDAEKFLIFRFLLIRHTLTHLVTITRFWQKGLKEKLYNYWVLHKELELLNELLG